MSFLAPLLRLILRQRKLARQVERGPHARVIGLAGAGDVEGGAVVHARAEERQADGHVHPALEAHQLYRDVPLVVVLDDHHVELPLARSGKDRVGGMGTAGIYALLHGFGDGRCDPLGVLVSEEAMLARMRVQARNRYPRLFHPDLGESVSREVDHGQDPFLADAVYRLPKRDVGADMDDAQLARHEHHREISSAGELGQYLGVPRVLVSSEVHRLLVQWRRRDGLHAPLQRKLRRPADVLEGRRPSTRIQLSEPQILRQLAHLEHVHATLLEERLLRVGDLVHAERQLEQARRPTQHPAIPNDEGLVLVLETLFGKGSGDYLRSDPRRVSHGDRHDGSFHVSLSFRGSASVRKASRKVSGPPKPPALVITCYGRGPMRYPTGTPASISPPSRMPVAPNSHATRTAVSPPVSTSASKRSSPESPATTSASASATRSEISPLATPRSPESTSSPVAEYRTAPRPPERAVRTSSAAPPMASSRDLVTSAAASRATAATPGSSTRRQSCSRATSLTLPTTVSTPVAGVGA